MEGVRLWNLASCFARSNCSPTARSRLPSSMGSPAGWRPSPGRSSPRCPAPRAAGTPTPISPGSSPTSSEERRGDRLPPRPRPPDHPAVRRRGPLGPRTRCSTNWAARSPGRSAEPDAVLVFDPSAFPKKGTASVGVQRQWCGRLGKVENCQVGVFLGYVSDADHALVDFRLYLPQEWAKDRKRRKRCGVPKEVKYRRGTSWPWRCSSGAAAMLPHGWIAGDDEMGRPAWFRKRIGRGWASDTCWPCRRTRRSATSRPSRRRTAVTVAGPRPPFRGVRAWCEALPAEAWTRLSVRDGEKGPLEVEMVVAACGVEGRRPGRRLRGDAGGGAVRGRWCAEA